MNTAAYKLKISEQLAREDDPVVLQQVMSLLTKKPKVQISKAEAERVEKGYKSFVEGRTFPDTAADEIYARARGL